MKNIELIIREAIENDFSEINSLYKILINELNLDVLDLMKTL
jgi:hypothetical protein